MSLSNLTRVKGIKGSKKRIGRGIGSGKGGHTVGRGTKGQNARRGSKFTLGFEGGQVPLYKRLPQLGGFTNPTENDIIAVTTTQLNYLDEKAHVTPELLLEKGLIKRIPLDGVKIILGNKVGKNFTLKGFLYSKGARASLEKSGSKINE
jgi:large subunit ribosomal protein L15